MKLLLYYRYLYYKILIFYKKFPYNHVPEYTASLIVGLLLLTNFQTILVLISIFCRENLLIFKDRFLQAISIIIFFIGNYFILAFRKNYENIVEEFKNETIVEKRKGNRIVIAYIIGTFILAMAVSILKAIIFKQI